MFNLSDEIADQYYLRSYGVCEKINANKFIFDQYHQLKLIEPVKTKIVSKVRFICNFFGIYTYILSNEATYFVGIRTSLWATTRASIVSPILLPGREAAEVSESIGGCL
jgi:hypothetical protein